MNYKQINLIGTITVEAGMSMIGILYISTWGIVPLVIGLSMLIGGLFP